MENSENEAVADVPVFGLKILKRNRASFSLKSSPYSLQTEFDNITVSPAETKSRTIKSRKASRTSVSLPRGSVIGGNLIVVNRKVRHKQNSGDLSSAISLNILSEPTTPSSPVSNDRLKSHPSIASGSLSLRVPSQVYHRSINSVAKHQSSSGSDRHLDKMPEPIRRTKSPETLRQIDRDILRTIHRTVGSNETTQDIIDKWKIMLMQHREAVSIPYYSSILRYIMKFMPNPPSGLFHLFILGELTIRLGFTTGFHIY